MDKYKSILGIFVCLLLSAGNGFSNGNEKVSEQKESINWVSIEEAEKLNAENPKRIMVDVYTDWCGWCKVMDRKTFADPDVASYVNENFYAVKLNAESQDQVTIKGRTYTKSQLAREFRVNSFPTIVFIEKDFKTVQAQPGFKKPVAFIKLLERINE